MTCENEVEEKAPETLEEMVQRHRSIATYRLYLFEPCKPKGKQKTYLQPFGLKWDEAVARRDALNEELKAAGQVGFSAPGYGVALENGWECQTPQAKARHKLLGKGPEDFNLA